MQLVLDMDNNRYNLLCPCPHKQATELAHRLATELAHKQAIGPVHRLAIQPVYRLAIGPVHGLGDELALEPACIHLPLQQAGISSQPLTLAHTDLLLQVLHRPSASFLQLPPPSG